MRFDPAMSEVEGEHSNDYTTVPPSPDACVEVEEVTPASYFNYNNYFYKFPSDKISGQAYYFNTHYFIWIIFSRNVDNGTRDRCLKFGGDLNHYLDAEIFGRIFYQCTHKQC